MLLEFFLFLSRSIYFIGYLSLPSPTGAGLDCLNGMTTLETSDSSKSPEDKNEECEDFLFVKTRIKANVYMTMNANLTRRFLCHAG